METHRCTGHCCKRFNLPLSPTEFERLNEAVNNEKESFVLDSGEETHFCYPKEEINKISDMIIYLELSEIGPGGEPFGNAQTEEEIKYAKSQGCVVENGVKKSHFYTCKHFNTETNDCMNYDQRPNMCKNHPYGRNCNFTGCTLRVSDNKCL